LELPPAADGPVLRRRRLPADDGRRAALPQDAVGGRPAGAVAVGLAVGQLQSAAVDGDVVIQYARGPALNRPAEAQRLRRLTFDKGVRPGRQVADGKVVPPLLRAAAPEQRLLPAGVEGPPPVAADLRDGLPRAAVLDRHLLAAFPDGDG